MTWARRRWTDVTYPVPWTPPAPPTRGRPRLIDVIRWSG